MSVLRAFNWLSQARIDVSHLRSIDSSVAADFDVVAGRVQAGSKALVIRGFTLANTAAGSPATSIQLSTADGILYNQLATESGTFLWVPANRPIETLNSATNPRISGSFSAGQVNYIGLDLLRSADNSTSDIVMFLDPVTQQQQAKNVPLARTLDYQIIITTVPFSASPNIIPVAKIKTDSLNRIDSVAGSVQDARNIMWRLGAGGDSPNQYSGFTWPQNRTEYDSSIIALAGLDKFSGGDKGLQSQKDWMDAVTSRLWELGGGEHWYAPTTDRDVKIIYSQPVLISTGDNWSWTLGTQTLQWASLAISFANSLVNSNAIADGSATVNDGQCLYVDVDRRSTATLTPQVGTLTTLGLAAFPFARYILAWRVGNFVFVRDRYSELGRTIQVATTTISGTTKLKYTAGTPSDPIVLAQDANGSFNNTATLGSNAAGFAGIGDGVGAGVSGTGGSGTSGPGIFGTGGSFSGRGGLFQGGSPNGEGIRAVGEGSGSGVFAQGGVGSGAIGVWATGGTTNGIGIRGDGIGTGNGGVFNGGATNADALLVTAGGTGFGLNSLAGGVQIPAISNYVYASAVTRNSHVGPGQFFWSSTTYELDSGDGQHIDGAFNVAGNILAGTGQVKLPSGATITAIDVLWDNTVGIPQPGCVTQVYLLTKSTTYTATTVANVSIEIAASTRAWYSITLSGGGPFVVPADGRIKITISTPVVAGSTTGFRGIRFTYTHTTLVPSV